MKTIDNPQLTNLRFRNGMLILPWVYCRIMGNLNEQKFSGEGMKPKSMWKRMWNLLMQWKHFRTKQKNILIFTSTLFNTQNAEGKYFNMLHGYYYDLFPNDTLMIEDGDMNNEWRETDLYPCTSYINTFYSVLAFYLSKFASLIHPYKSPDYEVISKQYPEWITTKELERMDHFAGIYECLIRRFVKRVNPKVIIINCGSYGHMMGCICKVAHELRIKTIETQHGLVYNHVTYCAPDHIRNNKDYMNYMPDTIFTFGEFWNGCIDWTYEKIPVGNPFLNEFVPKFANITEFVQDVLVISQPNYKEMQVAFVKELARLLPDMIVTIRLHPIEKLEKQKELYADCNNIRFSDSTKLLYEDMCSSRYVVGWYSTCLYEYLAFGRKPFIVDGEKSRLQVHQDVGIWVKSAEEMAQYVKEGFSPVSTNYETIWKQDFANNVRLYITTVIQKAS